MNASLIEDNSGGLSSVRVLMLTWGVGVFLIWGLGSVFAVANARPFPALPAEVVTITLGVTGIKCVQRFGERGDSSAVVKN